MNIDFELESSFSSFPRGLPEDYVRVCSTAGPDWIPV